ncbi:MAG: choline/ethanolamine kinase family protein [Pseudomonadota bacterium]
MTDKIDTIRSMDLWTGAVEVEPLHGGLSNESFAVTDGDQRYVVRFGRDFPFHHVSREREVMITRAAFQAGFAPELVHAEPGVMVSRFIQAYTYTEADVQADCAALADLVRRFHQTMPTHVSGQATIFWVFHVIRDYARMLIEANHRYAGRCGDWLALSARLEALQVPLPIVFGHHDLLAANFLKDERRLWLIDFEYAAYGTAMFDLAGLASNSRLDRGQSADLLRAYFGAPASSDIVRSHAAMQAASLLREAMWSMVSEMHLDTPGVDYVAYSDEQLDRLDRCLHSHAADFGAP